MEEYLRRAKEASYTISVLNDKIKSAVLKEMAKEIRENSDLIKRENQKDLQKAKELNLSEAMIDRLLLDDKRIESIAISLEEISALKDPVGRVIDGWINKDGLKIEKVAVPIGVIGVIYESRPNVTADVGGLCFKSGNVAILKGGKEAIHSNSILATLMQNVLERFNLPKEAISLLPDSSREGVLYLIKQDKYVDLIIPRGGEALIKFVASNSTIPVVKHDKGLCHTYLHKDCDIKKAIDIAVNAKCDRPGVCNAMETLLVDRDIAKEILPKLKEAFDQFHTELRGDSKTLEYIEVKEATNEDFDTEYLANILSIKVVENIDEAIDHIRRYGSSHSEAIVTENYSAAQYFLDRVDAACVYVNASTRFTDGGVFGFGAEVGISTNKIHARGPMGIDDLTIYKYKIYGNGHIRK
ncbi:MAG: glutamate-5-semialdehyde dehydrogenase [Epsilonproteobacteria bacterium]|nr:glutamate-5-semialdehyde dehydrogenase [Campylobacterota bacterium]